MKTAFNLETSIGQGNFCDCGVIKIVGKAPKDSPYVAVEITGHNYVFVKDKDLERFAVNILKALKSKKLHP